MRIDLLVKIGRLIIALILTMTILIISMMLTGCVHYRQNQDIAKELMPYSMRLEEKQGVLLELSIQYKL